MLDNPFKVNVMVTKMICDLKFIPFDKNTHLLNFVLFITNPLTPEQVLAKASNPVSGMQNIYSHSITFLLAASCEGNKCEYLEVVSANKFMSKIFHTRQSII